MSWWERHKKKVYIAGAVAVVALVPAGTLIVSYFYAKNKSDEKMPDNKTEEKVEEKKDE